MSEIDVEVTVLVAIIVFAFVIGASIHVTQHRNCSHDWARQV